MKENVFKLTGHAGKFVRDNMGAFRLQTIQILPWFLVLALVNHIGNVYGRAEVIYITALPFLYLMSCFSMGWHRVSLRGTDSASIKSPLRWEAGDGKFHAMFIGLLLFVLGFSEMAENVTAYLDMQTNQALVLFGSLSTLIVMVAVLFFSVRLMFFLPAQSVGVTLSYDDIKKASRGSMLRFVLAMVLTSVTFILILSIYLLIVSVILQATGTNEEASSLSSAFVAFFLSIPVYIAMFFYWAVNVTIMSRLYSWGMQNNA